MSQQSKTFIEFLNSEKNSLIQQDLKDLLLDVANSCKKISHAVHQGALANLLGSAGTGNIQGETQQKLDIFANELLLEDHAEKGKLAAMASEEMDSIYSIKEHLRGPYLLLFDPLDGSSNIDVNVSIGTIFSVLKSSSITNDPSEADFLQSGKNQVAAGYALYGPQTIFVLTLGHGVQMFTMDPQSQEFYLTQEDVQIPKDTKGFAINMSNMRHWAKPVSRYVS
ncbi:MAG: class 1 fructose-bisphosphatase [Betaproteobacteria bacterium]